MPGDQSRTLGGNCKSQSDHDLLGLQLTTEIMILAKLSYYTAQCVESLWIGQVEFLG